jgi:NTE family protein
MSVNFTRRQFLLAAAAGSLLPQSGRAANTSAAPQPKPAAKRKLAVVLGGGSARGFAHIGVIKALERAGIVPDLIVGCSAGSLVGAFWAAGFTGAQMEDTALRVQDTEVIDLVSGKAQYGLVGGRSLQNFVNQYLLNTPIENLKIPFAAVATEYPSGALTVFKQGDAGFAVRASCSIPGVFIPASQDNKDFVDGGLNSPIPVSTARALGANLVVAVDVGGPDRSPEGTRTLFSMVMRSFEIMSQSLRQHESRQADVLIQPQLANIRSTDFSSRRAAILLGQAAGERLVPVILAKLGTGRPSRRR